MASQLLPPSPPPTPTAITGLTDDLLRKIFLHLLSLVCATFACRDAVRSSPAFRRSFRALHAPPLLAFFHETKMEAVPVVFSTCIRSDSLLALTMDADFFRVSFSDHGNPGATGWEIHSSTPCIDGYIILEKVSGTARRAAFSPLTQLLELFIHPPEYIQFEFYTLSSEDGQGPSRVVYVRHDSRLADSTLAETTAVVFSCDTMEWQFSRKTTVRLRKLEGYRSAMVVSGLICWPDWIHDQIVMFNSTTCQFSLIHLPTPLKTLLNTPFTREDITTYQLGETKDGKFFIIDIREETLVSWFMTTPHDDDNVEERWIIYKNFSLHPIVKDFTGYSMEEDFHDVRVGLVAVIDGLVYLSIYYSKDIKHFEVYLSFCLETSEISELFRGAHRYNEQALPYVMPCPPSLVVQSKEESEIEFTGDSVADDGPVGTREASYALVAALQSLSQALMNDGDGNEEMVAELDAFLGCTCQASCADHYSKRPI